MITIGFYKGHNATACLLRDGQILAAVSEERFNRIKNSDIFPKQTITYCLEYAGVKTSDVDYFVRIYQHPEGYVSPAGETHNPKLTDIILAPAKFLNRVTFRYPSIGFFIKNTHALLSEKFLNSIFQKQFVTNMAKYLNIDESKIIFANHHLCHAYGAYYGFVPKNDQHKDHLVITLDGEGDNLCSTIWTVKKGEWKKIVQTPGGNSIATFYGLITEFLGMKMNEHEYKVMGLAPYASISELEKVYPLFKKLFWIDSKLSFHSKYPSSTYLNYFEKILQNFRFDGIAAAAQKFVEDLVVDFVVKAINKTRIRNLVLSGGFFMNIKANKKISEIQEVERLIVCPTAGDESASFGGAYYGYLLVKNSPSNIQNLYLGTDFSDHAIEKVIKEKNIKKNFFLKKYKDIEKEVARLLEAGKIVGRFKGRMEWGARALGNRSILMDPRRIDLKQQLNEQIKSRDFWMPFAPTILKEREKDYIVNPKNINGSFMQISFDTTKKGREDLVAAIHPYDFTCRPQILKEEDNPQYYKLIRYFEKLTGIGAVLNTSFNYHGEPIVCTPNDALRTFEITGLKYLALGNYLIAKRNEK